VTLPEGWEVRPLGEVVRLEYGKPLDPADRTPTGLYPAYGANGVKDRTDKFYCSSPSIIIGRKGSAGEITLTEGKFWPLDVTYFVDFDRKQIDLQFLYYLFTTLDLPNLAKGVKPGINRNEVYSIKIPLPPLPEQRRIVSILDEAFEAIATAKANTERNLENVREWATRQLTHVLEIASAQGGSGTLDSLVASSCSLSYGIVQPGDDVSGGLPIVRPVDLGARCVYKEGLKCIDPALARAYRRTTLEGGDLLLCVRGTTGTVSVADTALAGANVTRGIVPIRFEPAMVSQRLGYYLLRSESVQAQIRAKTYGSALMQINIKDLRNIVLHYPPLETQSDVAERLDEVQDAADAFATAYEQKLTALTELKQSLLHQAFTGALTAKSTDRQLEQVA